MLGETGDGHALFRAVAVCLSGLLVDYLLSCIGLSGVFIAVNYMAVSTSTGSANVGNEAFYEKLFSTQPGSNRRFINCLSSKKYAHPQQYKKTNPWHVPSFFLRDTCYCQLRTKRSRVKFHPFRFGGW